MGEIKQIARKIKGPQDSALYYNPETVSGGMGNQVENINKPGYGVPANETFPGNFPVVRKQEVESLGPQKPKSKLQQEILGKIKHFLEKYEQKQLVPKEITEQVHRGGKVFERKRTIFVSPKLEIPKELQGKINKVYKDKEGRRWKLVGFRQDQQKKYHPIYEGIQTRAEQRQFRDKPLYPGIVFRPRS